jgi:hypothetical protein
MVIHSVPQPVDIDKKLADIDKVFQYLEKMKTYCIKNLNKNRIANFSGKAYLTETAVNQFSSVFGIYEKDLKIEVIYKDGSKRPSTDPVFFQGDIDYFFISGTVGSKTFGVEASFEGGAKIKELNDNSKDDKLFWLKKAKANWRRRAISKLLGLDGISWEELGLKAEDCVQVSIGSTTKADSEKANAVWNDILGLCEGSVKNAEGLCAELTSFKGKDGNIVKGKARPHNLTEKALEFLSSKIENLKKASQAEELKKCKALLAQIGTEYEKNNANFNMMIDENDISQDDIKKKDSVFLNGFLTELKKRNQTSGSAKTN